MVLNKAPNFSLIKVPVQSLPETIQLKDAAEIAYQEDLEWIVRKLQEGISVLVLCEKILVPYLSELISQRLQQGEMPKKCICLAPALEKKYTPQRQYMKSLAVCLKDALSASDSDTVLVMPNLDIWTISLEHQAFQNVQEPLAWLYEYNWVTLLGFQDPKFICPEVISTFFPVKINILGIPDQCLPRLIQQSEARKFHPTFLNIHKIYRYVSGLNAIQLRKILASFLPLRNARNAEDETHVFQELRNHTCCSGFKLSDISMETDVAGYTQIKHTIKEHIIDLVLKKELCDQKSTLEQIDEMLPKGLLFSGPHGTGKNYLAKALASSLNAAWIKISCSDLKAKWTSYGRAQLHRIFCQARQCAPAMIILEKLDIFARVGECDCIESSMLRQLTAEMDQIHKDEMVFIVGITESLQCIDPSLFIPGRLELHIPFSYPDMTDRKEILELYKKKLEIPLTPEQIEEIAHRTGEYLSLEENLRFSTDYLYSLCRFLKRRLLIDDRAELSSKDINDAVTKIGKYNDRAELSQEEKWRLAIHKAGHCLLSRLLPYVQQIPSISISVQDVYFLEYNLRDIKARKVVMTRELLLDIVCLYLGGKIAEELILTDSSTCSVMDLQFATDIAQDMIEMYGMGPENIVGNYKVVMSSNKGAIPQRSISLRTMNIIDREMQTILQQQYARGKSLLKQHEKALRMLSAVLLDRASLGYLELNQFFENHPLMEENNDTTVP